MTRNELRLQRETLVKQREDLSHYGIERALTDTCIGLIDTCTRLINEVIELQEKVDGKKDKD